MRKAKIYIDSDELHVSSEVLRAIAHPLRMKILEFIDKNSDITVNQIHTILKLEQSITSQHLRILRDAGLVNTTRDGKYIQYSLNYERVALVVGAVNEFLEEE